MGTKPRTVSSQDGRIQRTFVGIEAIVYASSFTRSFSRVSFWIATMMRSTNVVITSAHRVMPFFVEVTDQVFADRTQGLGRGLVSAYLARPNTTVIAAVRNIGAEDSDSLRVLPSVSGSKVVLVTINATSDTDAIEAAEKLKRQESITSTFS